MAAHALSARSNALRAPSHARAGANRSRTRSVNIRAHGVGPGGGAHVSSVKDLKGKRASTGVDPAAWATVDLTKIARSAPHRSPY